MTNNEFQHARQGSWVKTPTLVGKIYRVNYETGKIQITVTAPLRRRGQHAHVKFENVSYEGAVEQFNKLIYGGK